VDGAEFAQWLHDMEVRNERDLNTGAQMSGWQTAVASFVDACDARVSSFLVFLL
jgi:hypothetical protein